MKQIFIVHTQYNVMLAAGLAGEHDDIVLFRDFDLKESLERKIRSLFGRCLILDGAYPKKTLTAKEKLSAIGSAVSALKGFITTAYDRAFIIEDTCIPEMYAMKLIRRFNPKAEIAWLEDGTNAYFRNTSISEGMGSTPLKRFIRKAFFSVRYSLGKFYDLGECMGAHRMTSAVYVNYPAFVRSGLSGKKAVGITEEQFRKGMECLFKGEPCTFEEDSLFIAMDRLAVYGDKLPAVDAAVRKVMEEAQSRGQKVYCKYHPRETDKLPALAAAEEVDCRTALEYYMTNASTKRIKFVGIKSTVLQNAMKLGFGACSLAGVTDGQDTPVLKFYRAIGMETL